MAFLAVFSELFFIALYAVGMIISDDVPLSSESVIAIKATKMTRMPILVHGFRVLPTEN